MNGFQSYWLQMKVQEKLTTKNLFPDGRHERETTASVRRNCKIGKIRRNLQNRSAQNLKVFISHEYRNIENEK